MKRKSKFKKFFEFEVDHAIEVVDGVTVDIIYSHLFLGAWTITTEGSSRFFGKFLRMPSGNNLNLILLPKAFKGRIETNDFVRAIVLHEVGHIIQERKTPQLYPIRMISRLAFRYAKKSKVARFVLFDEATASLWALRQMKKEGRSLLKGAPALIFGWWTYWKAIQKATRNETK